MPYFFVDESGNVGFAFGHGSSPFFVLVLLWIKDPEELRQRLQHLKQARKLADRFEFKYRKIGNNPALLRAFLEVLALAPIQLWILAIDKRQMPFAIRQLGAQAFYNFALEQIAQVLPPALVADATLVLDDSTGTKKFKRAIRVHLSEMSRRLGWSQSFKKIIGQDSHRDLAIQAADVVAGLVAEMLETGSPTEYSFIAAKVVAFIRYPGSFDKENLPS